MGPKISLLILLLLLGICSTSGSVFPRPKSEIFAARSDTEFETHASQDNADETTLTFEIDSPQNVKVGCIGERSSAGDIADPLYYIIDITGEKKYVSPEGDVQILFSKTETNSEQLLTVAFEDLCFPEGCKVKTCATNRNDEDARKPTGWGSIFKFPSLPKLKSMNPFNEGTTFTFGSKAEAQGNFGSDFLNIGASLEGKAEVYTGTSTTTPPTTTTTPAPCVNTTTTPTPTPAPCVNTTTTPTPTPTTTPAPCETTTITIDDIIITINKQPSSGSQRRGRQIQGNPSTSTTTPISTTNPAPCETTTTPTTTTTPAPCETTTTPTTTTTPAPCETTTTPTTTTTPAPCETTTTPTPSTTTTPTPCEPPPSNKFLNAANVPQEQGPNSLVNSPNQAMHTPTIAEKIAELRNLGLIVSAPPTGVEDWLEKLITEQGNSDPYSWSALEKPDPKEDSDKGPSSRSNFEMQQKAAAYFATLPGAIRGEAPVIYYPSCSPDAYFQPAIINYCAGDDRFWKDDGFKQSLELSKVLKM